jgi:hypothetical protein
LATQGPRLTDLLPVTSSRDIAGRRVSHDLYLAEDFDTANAVEMISSPFTSLGQFACVVQATYLADLVREHNLRGSADPEVRQNTVLRLDLTLQAYGGALIPPPGEARGTYCGAYSIRTT